MIDEATLRRLYLEEKRSIRDIAIREQLPARIIYDALIRYQIPRRPSGFASLRADRHSGRFDETTLRRLYIEEQRTIREIAGLYQLSTRVVYDALSRYRIPRRTNGHRQPPAAIIALGDGSIDEPTLRRLYQEEGQSIATIAAATQCSPSRIRNALVRWQITRRRRGRRYRRI